MSKAKRSKRTMGTRKCIFCKSEATVTSEHLLSRRFHRLIPKTAKNFRVLRSVEYVDRSAYQQGKFNSDPRDWKIKCVCEGNCNNGWMRKLEERLDPLLADLFAGRARRIAPGELIDLATWAVMKAIVIDHIDPEDATTHHMQRYAVYANQQPPKSGWAVWLGHYPRSTWEGIFRSSPFLALSSEALAKRSSDLATHYNGSIISYAVGELFVQVVHAPKPFGIDKWSFPVLPDGGAVRRIWPAPAFGLVWPPQAMSGSDLTIAINLFRDFMTRSTRAKRYPETLWA
jgi:hypothetical protein